MLGPALTPGPILHMRDYAGPTYDGVPTVGEHTAAVLGERLDLSTEALGALATASVISG